MQPELLLHQGSATGVATLCKLSISGGTLCIDLQLCAGPGPGPDLPDLIRTRASGQKLVQDQDPGGMCMLDAMLHGSVAGHCMLASS